MSDCHCDSCIAWSHILSINYQLETFGSLMVQDAAGEIIMDEPNREALYRNSSRLMFERDHVWWPALEGSCAKHGSWNTAEEYQKLQHECLPLWIRNPN